MSEVNTKWMALNKARMKQKLINIHQNIEIIVANSIDHELTDNEWLPGGILIAFWGPIVLVLDSTKITIDKTEK